MKVDKDTDRVGKDVIVTERMRVLHSVMLSGAPLEKRLRVEYLQGESTNLFVQTTPMLHEVDRRETRTWDYVAIASGDFNGDKLKGLKEYAEELFPEADKPVITFRNIIIHESECVFQSKPARSAPKEQVVHSQLRQLGD